MPLGSATGKIVGGPDCWSIISGNGDFVTVGSGRVVFESVVNLLEVGDNDLQNLVSWSKYQIVAECRCSWHPLGFQIA